ncbi:TOMM precursor leader peptide-binding protein [Dactylosporangium sp. NPDC005555]|uniref:TOMM precursor leader peptide-binding protein n=1 Tax=Dactylosporangium sp. NPDC005555 TaxID=3154889 RepID=UPI00339ED237
MRPTLLPNLRRLWRDASTVQLGTDPAGAVVLHLRRPELARVLDLLDGAHTEPAVLAAGEALGLAAADVGGLVDLLRDEGLVVGAHALVPAGLPERAHRRLSIEAAAIALQMRKDRHEQPHNDRHGATSRDRHEQPRKDRHEATREDRGREEPADVLRRRYTSRVVVAGDGPLLAPLAALLAASGVGHVDLVVDGVTGAGDVLVGGLLADDVGVSRAVATGNAVARCAPGADLSAARTGHVDLVVRVGDRHPPALARRGLRLGGLARLELTVRLGTVLIGPLVRPASSPCGACLDLHRRDRDPIWPVLAAQLATAPPGDGEPCASATALAGVAFAADEVLAFLDGTAARTEAAIVEIPRAGELRRRVWVAHPRCDCRRRRRAAQNG